MEWTPAAIDELRSLWLEGHSTAEIGRRMGVTKNAVVGKAHRLLLAARPSPIRREQGGAARRTGRAAPGPQAGAAAPTPVSAGPAEAAPAARPTLHAVPAARPQGRVSPCCWPIGEPGTRSFRFCDEATLPNKPYCATHAQLAYVKVRDRRDSAA